MHACEVQKQCIIKKKIQHFDKNLYGVTYDNMPVAEGRG